MIQSKEQVTEPREVKVTEPREVTPGDMHRSGIPTPGRLGAAKKQVWALAAGILVLLLIIAAAIIDAQV